MRFVCESCRAQYMINDEKVGPKGVKVRCRKCGYVILVKRPEAAKNAGPVAMSNDPDDALATQVMQTPLAVAEATLSSSDATAVGEDFTNPGNVQVSLGADKVDPTENFFGADEDEIGAVFDQVLKTGNNQMSRDAGGGTPMSEDDRQSTRVIDADTVRKLAEESGAHDHAAQEKEEEAPQTDWYVAINDKQTGPLTIATIKDHWDRGEISPDSLCWRAGFDDWLPVSEVKVLNAVLAPKPPKPIVVAPAATVTQSSPVVSLPVHSAFSSGGMMQTMQSEVQVQMSGGPASIEDSGGWKPSAASALASLVKDEMDALARPVPMTVPPPAVDDGGGLLDLPRQEDAKPSAPPVHSRPQQPVAPPLNPYLQNPGATYSAPAVTQYRPPSNRGLIIGFAGGAVAILIVLIGLIVWLGTREQTVVVQAPTPAPTIVAQAPTPQPAVVPTPAPIPVVAQPTPVEPPDTRPTTPPQQVAAANPPAPRAASKNTHSPSKAEREPEPDPTPKAEPKKSARSGDGTSFEEAFGVPSKEAAPAKQEPKVKPQVYVPPAPGGGGAVQPELGQSDIIEVVSSVKGQLIKCTEEQKKREPGVTGKLVMKWTVQTSGKVSNVSVVSDEFKGTYMAGCVGGLIKGLVFPRHKTQHEPIQFPFKF